MKTVHKYPLVNQPAFTLVMKEGAKIIHVGAQADEPCLWALVDTEAEDETREFCVVGTGEPANFTSSQYIGTFYQHAGRWVWHLFEVTF